VPVGWFEDIRAGSIARIWSVRLWLFGPGHAVVWLRGNPNKIMRTEDGGVRWHTVNLPTFGQGVMDLSFVDSADGWALFADVGVGQIANALYRTRDGGNHWTRVATAEPGASELNGLPATHWTDMEFRDAEHGWIGTALDATETMPSLYMTSNGGATWKRQQMPRPTGVEPIGAVFAPRFFGDSTGVAVALLGGPNEATKPFFYATSDGGRTSADPRPSPAAAGGRGRSLVWNVLTPSRWAVATSHRAWLSSDGGRDWSQLHIPLPPTSNMVGIVLSGPKGVWVSGQEMGAASSCVLETQDNGLSWTRVVVP
jgi:photosystem II stability/assembly factor-like uncharacterized protein